MRRLAPPRPRLNDQPWSIERERRRYGVRAPFFQPIADQVGEINTAFSFAPIVSNPGGYSLTFSLSGTLQSGLTFNTSTGAISGTPTVDGYADFRITATYSLGFVTSEEFRITIAEFDPNFIYVVGYAENVENLAFDSAPPLVKNHSTAISKQWLCKLDKRNQAVVWALKIAEIEVAETTELWFPSIVAVPDGVIVIGSVPVSDYSPFTTKFYDVTSNVVPVDSCTISGKQGAWIIKYNTNGVFVWARQLKVGGGPSNSDSGAYPTVQSAFVRPNGNAVIGLALWMNNAFVNIDPTIDWLTLAGVPVGASPTATFGGAETHTDRSSNGIVVEISSSGNFVGFTMARAFTSHTGGAPLGGSVANDVLPPVVPASGAFATGGHLSRLESVGGASTTFLWGENEPNEFERIYAFGTAPTRKGIVAMYEANRTLRWVADITPEVAGNIDDIVEIHTMAMDESENVYVGASVNPNSIAGGTTTIHVRSAGWTTPQVALPVLRPNGGIRILYSPIYAKYDANGNVVWAKTIGIPGGGDPTPSLSQNRRCSITVVNDIPYLCFRLGDVSTNTGVILDQGLPSQVTVRNERRGLGNTTPPMGSQIVIARLNPANGTVVWVKTVDATHTVCSSGTATGARDGSENRAVAHRLIAVGNNLLFSDEYHVSASGSGGGLFYGEGEVNETFLELDENSKYSTMAMFDAETGALQWARHLPTGGTTTGTGQISQIFGMSVEVPA